jgi:hypothetical protein
MENDENTLNQENQEGGESHPQQEEKKREYTFDSEETRQQSSLYIIKSKF